MHFALAIPEINQKATIPCYLALQLEQNEYQKTDRDIQNLHSA